MIIKEYRIVLPMTVQEYQVAQLYSVAEASKNETGGGEGIEVLINEPFSATEGVQPKTPLLNGSYTAGQYTHKIYHLASKVPTFARALAPKGSLHIHEEAWNAFPYCRTLLSNPYMKENFLIKIESIHLADKGEEANAHDLDEETLAKREIVRIDIANDAVEEKDYKTDEDPSLFKSEKTGRGPLTEPGWETSCSACPVMCCYKLVTVDFKWWGLQGTIEAIIHKSERRIFTNFHRQVFCWTDRWYGLTMDAIRAIEDKTKAELDEQRKHGPVRGTKE